jgi:ArsR family transcriptional regulator
MIRNRMKNKAEFQECAERLKALADGDRLRILLRLFEGAASVSDLAEALGDDIAKVSHHLGVLRRAGVAQAEKQGRYVIYRLHPAVTIDRDHQGNELRINFGCCTLDLHAER